MENVQRMLSHKMKELEIYRNKCESLENENDKLKTWKTTKEKAIENLKNSYLSEALQSQSRKQESAMESKREDVRSVMIPEPKKSFSEKKRETSLSKNVKLFGT